MPILFYILSGLGFLSAGAAFLSLQFALAGTAVTSAIFCLGFGYMIALLEEIRNNTKPASSMRAKMKTDVPAGYEDVYHGYPFRRLDRGQIEVKTETGVHVFKSWQEFHSAVAK